MSRYDAPMVAEARGLDFFMPGVGVFRVSPGEQKAAAEAWCRAVPQTQLRTLEELLHPQPGLYVVAGLGPTGDPKETLLRTWNNGRERRHDVGQRVVLIVDPAELQRLLQAAPDSASVFHFVETLPLEPDPSVDASAAGVALRRWCAGRWGRLDLRGLIRAESEDVAWKLEEVFVEPRVLPRLPLPGLPGEPVSARIFAPHAGRGRVVVVLGHPGSGKSCVLRWLATRDPGEDGRVAVLVPLSALPRVRDAEGLLGGVCDYLLADKQEYGHVLHAELLAGRAMLLLDGLDEVGHWRAELVAAIVALAARERCLIVVTSRVTGYDQAPFPESSPLGSLLPEVARAEAPEDLETTVDVVELAPLNDTEIGQFLARWCARYAQDRLGPGAEVRAGGQAEGEALANEVIAHAQLRPLAQNPLLLTVLAIVHRAGLRLPDHRVELYAHATRVLVERWSRIRKLEAPGEFRPPMRVVDAVRILGPVAIELLEGGGRGALTDARILAAIRRALTAGKLRGFGTAESVLEHLRSELGLLVESGPGVWAFLHLSFAEYFAALELIRSGELERLSADPARVFLPQWQEVLLLAAGELGLARAEDDRVEALVGMMLASAAKKDEGTGVPELLGGLLADDPQLSPELAQRLIDVLVPKYWLDLPVFATGRIRRVIQGVFGSKLRNALRVAYGADLSEPRLERLRPVLHRMGLPRLLIWLGVDPGILIQRLSTGKLTRPVEAEIVPPAPSTMAIRLRVSRFLDGRVRSGLVRSEVWLVWNGADGWQERVAVDWASTVLVREDDVSCVIEIALPDHADPLGVFIAGVRLLPSEGIADPASPN